MPDEARRQGAERTLAASVIIPVFRDTERLRKCLRCLEQQTLPADRFEIIVVNNDPEEQLRLASATHRLVLLDEPTPGSYA
ncbi:MAG: glycosyltransferase, partial [Pseudomonadota bacterium]